MRTLLLAAAALSLAACGDEPADPISSAPEPSGDGEEGEVYTPLDPASKADGLALPDGPLVFEGACEPGERLTIAAGGDVLIHGRLQKQAFERDDGFISLWAGVKDLLAVADVTYLNLEGPTARGVDARGRDVPDPGRVFDGVVYSSYPMFNYHPDLVSDMLASGVDVVSTANNHALDRWSLGADRTIDALEEAGLPFTGTRRSDGVGEWYTVTEHQGFKLAWLACTYGTNGLPDHKDQVLFCFEDREEVVGLVKSLSARGDLDAVIVTPHWGLEYQANPADKQVSLAHDLIDAGATLVIGSHPHVLQPWERHVTPDGREGFVIYSLGNFISGQRHLPRRSTLLLYVGLTRASDGRVLVNGARYVPLHMTTDGEGMHLDAIDRVGGLTDSRALTVSMFDPFNVMPPAEAAAGVIANPHCDPSWTPPPSPHPHDGWIGGACDGAEDCGGGVCLEQMPGGLCTEACDRYCPDHAGRAPTFCVDLGFDNGGLCVAQCTVDRDCRPGYTCQEAGRYGEAEVSRAACLPAPE